MLMSVLGVPPSMFNGAGVAQRETFRHFLITTLLPLAHLLQAELRDKLDIEDLTITFPEIAQGDIAGRARPFGILVQQGQMDPEEALQLVGIR